MKKPFPTELQGAMTPEMVGAKGVPSDFQRNLFCVHYDTCLDEAVKKGWNSFTCVRCAFLGEVSTDKDEQRAGIERYATERRMV